MACVFRIEDAMSLYIKVNAAQHCSKTDELKTITT